MNLKRVCGVFLTLSISASSLLAFQDDAPLAVDVIEERLKSLEESSEEDRDKLIEIYSQALASLKRAAEFRDRAGDDAAEAAKAPGLLESLRSELSTLPTEQNLELGPDQSLEEVEKAFKLADAKLSAARAEEDELVRLAAFRAARKAVLLGEITAAQQALSMTQEALNATPAGDLKFDPTRIALRAQLQEREAALLQLQSERDLYVAEQDLVTLKREKANQLVARLQAESAFWEEAANQRRYAEGDAAALDTSRRLDELTKNHPTLEPLAKHVQNLVSRRAGEDGLPRRITYARAEKEKTLLFLDETKRRQRSARLRIDAGGLTEAMGIILRRDLEWLPKRARLRLDSEDREKKLSATLLELITIEEALIQEGSVSIELNSFLAEHDVIEPSEALLEGGHRLLQLQRETLRSLQDDLATLVSVHYDHRHLATQLIDEVNSYRDLIEQNILWVRSSAQNPLASLRSLPKHAASVMQRIREESLGFAVWSAARRHFLASILVIAFIATLISTRRFLRRQRVEMGTMVRSYRTDSYIFTIRAIIQTLLLALPLPLLFWLLGWLLSDAPDELNRSIGYGLR